MYMMKLKILLKFNIKMNIKLCYKMPENVKSCDV